MESFLRSLLLLIHTWAVFAESVIGSCEQQQDGIECADALDSDSQQYIVVHDESRVSENINREE